MSRLKHLWLSFWQKDQGLGLIETAVALPLFLLITFGLMEFGNMFITRYQVRDVSDSVGDFLQTNPNASSTELREFVTNLGFGTLKDTDVGQNNEVFAKIKIQSARAMMTEAQFDALCSGGSVQNWGNPWAGGSPADDFNPYYIHVCYTYTYKAITPLLTLSGGAFPETKSLRGKAIAYTQPIFTCPEGQVLSNRGGAPVCTQINAACQNGEYLIRVVGTTAVCARPSIHIEPRYRPLTSENDCSDYVNAVQVGMSGSDSGERPSAFDLTGIFDDPIGTPRKVWCANLQVR